LAGAIALANAPADEDGGKPIAAAQGTANVWTRVALEGRTKGRPLRGIAVSADGTRGWAVGNACLRLADGKWVFDDRAEEAAGLGGLDAAALNVSGERGWAVGTYGVMRLEGDRWHRDESGTSAAVSVRSGLSVGVRAIAIESANDGNGWAVGDSGIVLRLEHGRWKRDDSASSLTTVNLTTIALENDRSTDGWAMGIYNVLRLERGTWRSDDASKREVRARVLECVALDRKDGKRGWAVGAGGTIFRLEKGHWVYDEKASKVAEGRYLGAVAFSAAKPDEAWAVGMGGVVLHAVGDEWTKCSIEQDVTSANALTNVACSARDVWAIGTECTIIRRPE
jgi:hypothetical protein